MLPWGAAGQDGQGELSRRMPLKFSVNGCRQRAGCARQLWAGGWGRSWEGAHVCNQGLNLSYRGWKSYVKVITFCFAAVMAADGAWKGNKPTATWEPGRDGTSATPLANGSKCRWRPPAAAPALAVPSGSVSAVFRVDGSSVGKGHPRHTQPRLPSSLPGP